MDLTLSALTAADAGELLTIRRAAYVSEAQRLKDPYIPELTQSLEEIVADLKTDGVVTIGTRATGRLVGSIRVAIDATRATISHLAVVPDRRSEGIGQQLLLAILDYLPPTVGEVAIQTGRDALAAVDLVGQSGSIGSLARAYLARIQPALDARGHR